MSNARLVITDGTTEISLIKDRDHQRGFYLEAWRPMVPGYKGGGVWQQSSLSDGRVLVDKHFNNYIDTLSLKAYGYYQDVLIREMQDIRRLLEKASDYWISGWTTEPVWIEARAAGETNLRYAVIYSGRIAEDDNPYAQPFLQTCSSVMDKLTLVIEHGFWQDREPGSSSSVSVCDSGVYTDVTPLQFYPNGVAPVVSANVLTTGYDDLPDNAVAGNGQITVDAWIYPTGYSSNFSTIAAKGCTAGQGAWEFSIYSVSGLYGTVQCVGQSAITTSGIPYGAFFRTPMVPEWMHVLMCYDETGAGTPAARTIYLAINGQWITPSTQQASIGNYIGDAAPAVGAGELTIGNINTALCGNHPFDGDIGWIRIFGSIPYTPGVNFTPPSRCYLPGETPPLGLYIYEGTGVTTSSAGSVNDLASITDAVWDTDKACDEDCVTTTDGVYVANKRNVAAISHIYIDDGGVSSGNLVGAASYELFPTVPVVNDAIYFGIDTTVAATSGPFCSLVFDLAVAGAGYTARWEYWDGAWQVLTVDDNTDAAEPFDTAGVGSVHWIQPPAPNLWIAADLSVIVGGHMSAITGYWVRCIVTATPGALTAPQQQNKAVYTILEPYVEIPATSVGGDVPALSEIIETCVCDIGLNGEPHRFLIGLRSLSRGEDFTSIINTVQEQNPSGITVTLVGGVEANDITTSTGRSVSDSGAVGAWNPVMYIDLDQTIMSQYTGTYRAFLRANGADGDLITRIVVSIGISPSVEIYVSDAVAQDSVLNEWQLYDMGSFTVPSPEVLGNEAWLRLRFTVDISERSATAAVTKYSELILVPIDEWAIDVYPSHDSLGEPYLESGDYMRITSLNSKQAPLATKHEPVTDYIESIPYIISNGPSILLPNTTQRLWFVHGTANSSYRLSEYWQALKITASKVQRYLSMRGDR